MLNIGPEASGLVPSIMTNTLLDMGKWINRVNEAIFDSVPYWVTHQDEYTPNQPLYFMQSVNGKSFYIFSFLKPQLQRLVVKTKIPLHPYSNITLLSQSNPEKLQWNINQNDALIVNVPESISSTEDKIWVFKVEAPSI